MPNYTHLGGTFWKSDSEVFSEGRPLKLDPSKTKVFFDVWATDDIRVYNYGSYLRKIDASSFVALNSSYAKDANACYCGLSTTLKNADVDTIEVLDSGAEKIMLGFRENHKAGYVRDATQVFFDGMIVKHADPVSFVSLGNCFGRDEHSVFFTRFRLNGAVPLRWRQIGGCYSRDDRYVFYENRRIKNARIDHFRQIKPFDAQYANDGRTIFDRGEPTTAESYVHSLRTWVRLVSQSADLVESGVWQMNLQKSERHYRAPDETLNAYDAVQLGDSLSKVVQSLGQGEIVPRRHWDFFFPPLSELIRQGLLKAAGAAAWSSEDANTPTGCRLYRWSHSEQVLACTFIDETVVAIVILDADHATPSH